MGFRIPQYTWYWEKVENAELKLQEIMEKMQYLIKVTRYKRLCSYMELQGKFESFVYLYGCCIELGTSRYYSSYLGY